MNISEKTIRIGTRASPLAMFQANTVLQLLREHHPKHNFELVEITTSGEWKPEDGENRLKEEDGGKGLFAKELEEALIHKDIDCAVHSMKDMETPLPDGLVINHMLPREDPRDAFISLTVPSLDALDAQSIIGTASVRREAFLKSRHPQVRVVPFRGNVQTRLRKLKDGQVDATFLALAGLKRLGLDSHVTEICETSVMLPAAGQGAIGIEIRANDFIMAGMLDPLSDDNTLLCVYAERGALEALDGTCHTPIGAYAFFKDQAKRSMEMTIAVCRQNGRDYCDISSIKTIQSPKEAAQFGYELGMALKAKAPTDILQ